MQLLVNARRYFLLPKELLSVSLLLSDRLPVTFRLRWKKVLHWKNFRTWIYVYTQFSFCWKVEQVNSTDDNNDTPEFFVMLHYNNMSDSCKGTWIMEIETCCIIYSPLCGGVMLHRASALSMKVVERDFSIMIHDHVVMEMTHWSGCTVM